MQIEELKSKRIGILGYGVEGQGLASYLNKHSIAYTIFDQNEDVKLLADHKQANLSKGKLVEEEIKKCEVIFRSPGIPLSNPAVESARNAGAEITSQIQLFFENCPAQIIGVTGTKGKSTTSKLIFEILKSAGKSVFLGGNFGAVVVDLLDTLKAEDYVVLELSSFQLQDLTISPHVAVVLAVHSDHLDYHKDVQEYWQAKTAITRFQKESDFAVVNIDSEGSKGIGELGKAKKYYIHSRYNAADPKKIEDGFVAEKSSGQLIFVQDSNESVYLQANEAPLRGFHNLQNIGSAALVAKIIGISDELIHSALRAYKGLEHRLEFVAEKNGIKFYNDSISTTSESSLAAIDSFDEPTIAILGGSDKGADYVNFGKEVALQKNLKAVVLLGEIAERIAQGLMDGGFSGKVFTGISGMKQAFEKIKEVSKEGDVVVLAPGAASFGMFKNYKDRGDQFKAEAHNF
jgi:UDP-N-acetylmuramoylalanine--D-glutamate ligase